jgi:hypothetical protein
MKDEAITKHLIKNQLNQWHQLEFSENYGKMIKIIILI